MPILPILTFPNKLNYDGTKVFNITKTGKENEPEVLGKLAGEEILKQSGKNFIKKR